MTNQGKECCPEFKPEKWDGKTFHWKNRPFIKESMHTFFHIPFPPTIGKKITKMCGLIEHSKKAEANKEETLVLFRDPSAFKSEIYISVAGPVPNANNAVISGEFIGKVFAGAYNAVPKFLKEMETFLAEKGKKAKDYYIHYAYCPKCAEKFGNNYMIIFAQV